MFGLARQVLCLPQESSQPYWGAPVIEGGQFAGRGLATGCLKHSWCQSQVGLKVLAVHLTLN